MSKRSRPRSNPTRPDDRCPCQTLGRQCATQNDRHGKTTPHLRLGQGADPQLYRDHPQPVARWHAGGKTGGQTCCLYSHGDGAGKGQSACWRGRLDRRRLGGQRRRAALSAVPAARRGLRRAAASAGDAARLRAGREQLRDQHPHEPHCHARALLRALPRAGPAGQSAGLLELVRHHGRPRAGRGGADHECHRPGLPVVPGRPRPRGGGRLVGRCQHGGAAGHAPPDHWRPRRRRWPRPGRRCW